MKRHSRLHHGGLIGVTLDKISFKGPNLCIKSAAAFQEYNIHLIILKK